MSTVPPPSPPAPPPAAAVSAAATEGAPAIESWRPRCEAAEGRPILQLPEEVINRIAAGEVVQRPANAVKELVENSLDAGATRILVTAVGGGLTMLRIEDNGHGINHEDFPLLCKRFATSKLATFDDLLSIGTFGFRGEALSSLSMVCRVEVTTRRRGPDALCWTGKFREGVLKEKESVVAGLNTSGTVLKATDMFYSMPQRRSMLNKPQEEYRLVVEVLTKYAIQYPHCSFVCRKAMDAAPDLSTSPAASPAAAIRSLYSKKLHDALVHVAVQNVDTLHYRAAVLASDLTYFGAKAEVITFINGRLVNHEGITKMVRQLYGPLLPKKAHPFVFVDLNVRPEHVDVNAHPTKERVIFLNETDVVAEIEAALQPPIEKSLESSGDLHLKRKLSAVEGSFGVASATAAAAAAASSADGAPKRRRTTEEYAHQMVRSDHTMEHGALEKYFYKHQAPAGAGSAAAVSGGAAALPRLSSVHRMLANIERAHDRELRDALSKSVYVGCANSRFVLLQLDLGLYLADFCAVSAELFYQRTLLDLGAHPKLATEGGVALTALLALATSDKDAAAAAVAALTSRSAMLDDLFSIEIRGGDAGDAGAGEEDGGGGGDEPCLAALPSLVDGYTPPLHKLPLFLLRLAAAATLQGEAGCVHAVAEELADFYMIDDGLLVEPSMEEPERATKASVAPPPPSLPAADTPEEASVAPAGASEAEAATVSALAVLAIPNMDSDSDSGGGCGCGGGGGGGDGDSDTDGSSDIPDAVKGGSIMSGIAQAKQAQQARAAAASAEPEDAASPAERETHPHLWVVRHVLHPCVKTSLLPPADWRDSHVLRRVADLPTMYKIFERC